MKCMVVCRLERAQVQSQTVECVPRIFRWLRDAGHSCTLDAEPWAEVAECRNLAAARFLDSDADFLIGIDDDVAVSREAFVCMLEANADCIGARVPARVIDLGQLADGIRRGTPGGASGDAAAARKPDSAGAVREVDQVGAAFHMVRREVLERILESGLAERSQMAIGPDQVPTVGFFDHLDDDGGNRLPEADSFCKRVRDAGFAIHEYDGPGISRISEIAFST